MFSVNVLWTFYYKRLSLHVEISNVSYLFIFFFVEFCLNGNKSNLQKKKIQNKCKDASQKLQLSMLQQYRMKSKKP